MRKTTIAVLCLVFAISGVALADNPPEPGAGGQNGSSCATCNTNDFGEGECHPDAVNGDWSDCEGGLICYSDPLSGSYCEPLCGHHRCYYV